MPRVAPSFTVTTSTSKATVANLLKRYGDNAHAPCVNCAVVGLPSQKISCSRHAVLCVLAQWMREVVYISIGLGRKLTICCRKRDPVYSIPKSVTSSSVKRVCFIRHGQGMHNTSMLGWELIDPPLTSKGEDQAKALQERLMPDRDAFELVMTSPLTRAIQTALFAFDGTSVPFLITPLLRERLGAPCDKGTTKSELIKTIPQIKTNKWIGLDELPEVWWCTQSVEMDLLSRVEKLKHFIFTRPEKVIAVVGHGGLFSRIVGKHLSNCGHVWVEWKSPTSSDIF